MGFNVLLNTTYQMSVYDYLSNLSSLFLIIVVSKKHANGHNAENIIKICKNVFLHFSIATNPQKQGMQVS